MNIIKNENSFSCPLKYEDIIEYFDEEEIYFINNFPNINEEEKFLYLNNLYYFGYLIRDCALIYHFSEIDYYKNISFDIINFIQTYYSINGKLIPIGHKGNWYRDTFARTLHLFFEAYEYTKDIRILSIIEDQVSLWLELVPRKIHNSYFIFPYGIDSNNDQLDYEIDPNQNLELGLLFSDLYFCKNCKYYKNEIIRDIVYQETNAAISLITVNGELPLCERYINCFDSNYGGYSATLLYEISSLWGERTWINCLIKIGNWLYYSFPIDHPWNTEDDFPNWVKDRHYASNLAERIPAFYISGVSSKYCCSWVENLINLFPEYRKSLYFKFYGLKTFPSYYLNNTSICYYLGHDYPTIIENDNKLRVLWRSIEKMCYENQEYEFRKNDLSITIMPKSEITFVENVTQRRFTYYTRDRIETVSIIDYSHPLN